MTYQRFDVPVLQSAFAIGGIPNEKKESFILGIVKYLTRQDNFNSSFKGLVDHASMSTLRSALCSFDVCVRLKLALLGCWQKSADFWQACKIFLKNGLSRKDVWVWMAVRNMDQKVVTPELSIPTPEQIRTEAYNLIFTGSVDKVIRNTVRAKLWFVTSCQPITLQELETEVKTNALESFYLTSPFIVEAHKKPSIVRSAQNFISKIISYYTYSKRSRMVRQNGKFVHTTVSLDEPANEEDTDLGRYWYSALDTESSRHRDRFEKFSTIKAVARHVESSKICKKSEKALKVFCSCTHMDSFITEDHPDYRIVTEFLDRQSAKLGFRFNNTLELIDDIGEKRFMSAVRQYSGFSVDKWDNFLTWFRDYSVSCGTDSQRAYG